MHCPGSHAQIGLQPQRCSGSEWGPCTPTLRRRAARGVAALPCQPQGQGSLAAGPGGACPQVLPIPGSRGLHDNTWQRGGSRGRPAGSCRQNQQPRPKRSPGWCLPCHPPAAGSCLPSSAPSQPGLSSKPGEARRSGPARRCEPAGWLEHRGSCRPPGRRHWCPLWYQRRAAGAQWWARGPAAEPAPASEAGRQVPAPAPVPREPARPERLGAAADACLRPGCQHPQRRLHGQAAERPEARRVAYWSAEPRNVVSWCQLCWLVGPASHNARPHPSPPPRHSAARATTSSHIPAPLAIAPAQ